MAGGNDFFIPNLPSFSLDPVNHGFDSDYGQVQNMIKSIGDLPSLTNTLVPRVEQLIGERGKYLMPQIAAIRDQAGTFEANAQSDSTARNMRGSYIESAAMLGARTAGLNAESQLRGNFALEGTNTLIQTLTQAMSGDVQAATNLRAMLAQAMGQQIAGAQDRWYNNEAMSRGDKQAGQNRMFQLIGAGIGGAATLGAGAMISDAALKEDVSRVGKAGELDIVKFKWAADAEPLGLKGEAVGLLAQQVQAKYPKAVTTLKGHLAINYKKLPAKVRQEVAKLGGPKNG